VLVLVLGLILLVAVVVLAIIIIGSSRRIREEPPLDRTVETRILLGEDPARIAADLDAPPVIAEDPPELRTAEMQALREIGDDIAPAGSSPQPDA
jgi:hypothetical protein